MTDPEHNFIYLTGWVMHACPDGLTRVSIRLLHTRKWHIKRDFVKDIRWRPRGQNSWRQALVTSYFKAKLADVNYSLKMQIKHSFYYIPSILLDKSLWIQTIYTPATRAHWISVEKRQHATWVSVFCMLLGNKIKLNNQSGCDIK